MLSYCEMRLMLAISNKYTYKLSVVSVTGRLSVIGSLLGSILGPIIVDRLIRDVADDLDSLGTDDLKAFCVCVWATGFSLRPGRFAGSCSSILGKVNYASLPLDC